MPVDLKKNKSIASVKDAMLLFIFFESFAKVFARDFTFLQIHGKIKGMNAIFFAERK